MEDQILEILKQIQLEQVKTNKRLEKLEDGQGSLKLDVSSLKSDVQNLKEGQRKLEESQRKLEEGQNRIEKKIDFDTCFVNEF